MSEISKGTIIKIRGSVLDVRITDGRMPSVNSLVTCPETGHHMEVAAQVSENTVRCIALESTDGLMCGTECVSDGEPIKVPVGDAVIGRVVDVLGRPIDGGDEIKTDKYMSIHRQPPALSEQKPVSELLETGIKVIDLLAPRRCPATAVCREPSLRRQFAKHTKQSKPRPRTGRRGTRSFSGGEPLRRRIRRCAGGKQDRRCNAPAGCG